jgi:SAM-dependent methyltransferase
MNFDVRAELSEWMDEPCAYEEFRDCLKDLSQVNRFTLAYRPTLQWLQTVIEGANRALHIVDVGSGGGDTLRVIEAWARRKGIALRLTGVDLNPHAARGAAEFTPEKSLIEWQTGDAFSFDPATPIDCVISSLFTHHLPDEEIVKFLAWMERVSARGWFVNDLHRGRLPYVGFTLLAKTMRWHRFIQHDGPVSIRRSFQARDWMAYLDAAGIDRELVSVDPWWPSRLCLSRAKL